MERDRFTPLEVQAVLHEVTETGWLGENVLTNGFDGTRGFSLQLTREGFPRVRRRLPSLNPFLDLIETGRAVRLLRPKLARWLGAEPVRTPNAFYLNVLEVPVGDAVTPHVDGTLSLKHGFSWVPPLCNTVLYLRVLPNSARFALRVPRKSPQYFEEQAGDVLHFRGDCAHSLDRLADAYVDPTDKRSRLSVVCEQYWFPDELLAKIPAYKLESKDAFKKILAQKRNRA